MPASGFSRLTSRVFSKVATCGQRLSPWCWLPAAQCALAGPAAGRLADRLDAPKVILSLCSAVAALIALGYLPARGLWLLFAVGVFHSAALAPLAPLSDTLALGAAAAARSDDAIGRGFEYGWVRGAGSAAVILGSMLSGQAVGHFGIATVVWLNAALLAAAAFAALLVPQL